MKIEALHMSDAELEIMEYLWMEQRPVTAADIFDGLPHRKWKPSTVHTIAMHLIDEGFIKYFKANGKNYYIPYISDHDYSFVVSKAFVNKMHDGSIVEIVRTLLCDLELSRDELLRLWELVNSAVRQQESGEASVVTEESEKVVFSPIWVFTLSGIVYETIVYEAHCIMNEAEEKYLSSA